MPPAGQRLTHTSRSVCRRIHCELHQPRIDAHGERYESTVAKAPGSAPEKASEQDQQDWASLLNVSADDIIQEIGWDEDCDSSISEALEDATGSVLLEADTDEVVDKVLLWWRTEDGDLVDGLVDATRSLAAHPGRGQARFRGARRRGGIRSARWHGADQVRASWRVAGSVPRVLRNQALAPARTPPRCTPGAHPASGPFFGVHLRLW